MGRHSIPELVAIWLLKNSTATRNNHHSYSLALKFMIRNNKNATLKASNRKPIKQKQ